MAALGSVLREKGAADPAMKAQKQLIALIEGKAGASAPSPEDLKANRRAAAAAVRSLSR